MLCMWKPKKCHPRCAVNKTLVPTAYVLNHVLNPARLTLKPHWSVYSWGGHISHEGSPAALVHTWQTQLCTEPASKLKLLCNKQQVEANALTCIKLKEKVLLTLPSRTHILCLQRPLTRGATLSHRLSWELYIHTSLLLIRPPEGTETKSFFPFWHFYYRCNNGEVIVVGHPTSRQHVYATVMFCLWTMEEQYILSNFVLSWVFRVK